MHDFRSELLDSPPSTLPDPARTSSSAPFSACYRMTNRPEERLSDKPASLRVGVSYSVKDLPAEDTGSTPPSAPKV